LSLRGSFELSRILRKTDADIVHCPHFPTPVPLRAPLVVTLHDLIPLVFPGSMPSRLKRGVYRLGNARAIHRAAGVIVPSRATALDVSRLFPQAKNKIVVIPEAADDFASGPRATLTRELKGLASASYLLSMGNTKPHKDLHTLLEAFKILAISFPELRLLLVGPEQPGYLEERLADAPAAIAGRVHFTGPVDDARLRSLYAKAEAFVFPSRYEGFGLPALEAMALGTPVVCADAASLPEVVADAALLFPPGEQQALSTRLGELLSDPVLRQRSAEAGLARTSQFTWAKTAEATVAVYSSVLSRRGALAQGREQQ